MDTVKQYRAMFNYINFAKRQRNRRRKLGNQQQKVATPPPNNSKEPVQLVEEGSDGQIEIDTKKGMAIVLWANVPNDLVPELLMKESGFENQVLVKGFCGCTSVEICQFVAEKLDLSRYHQRLVDLTASEYQDLREGSGSSFQKQPDSYVFADDGGEGMRTSIGV
jgi:hypothetical protein